MNVHSAVPLELVDHWEESEQTLSPLQVVDFHYHDVEEWLTVVRGEITFFTLTDTPFQLDVAGTLHIPRGEVHRAEVGSDGVVYRMFLPVPIPSFAKKLTAEELDALMRNLEFPQYEDGRAEDGSEFFENALSDQLVFCRANGMCVDKRTFIEEAFVDKGRSSAGSIQILNRTENGLLISTVVDVADANGVHSFVNLRFLAAEGGTLRCRLWVNYPQHVPVPTTVNVKDETVSVAVMSTAARRN